MSNLKSDDGLINRAVRFVNEVKFEVSKITWPKKQEAINSTILVSIMAVVISAFLLLVDKLVLFVLKPILYAS